MRSSKAKWVALTAMGVALVVVAQYLGGLIPDIAVIFGPFRVKQLITGTLVNCVLLVFTAAAGLTSGVTIGVLSAILAGFLGMSQPFLSPVVAIGNAILCLIYFLLARRSHHLVAMSAGAVLKCAFLWLAVPMVLAAMAGLPEKQVAALSIMFSWPQSVTALCGGLLAWVILPRLPKRR